MMHCASFEGQHFLGGDEIHEGSAVMSGLRLLRSGDGLKNQPASIFGFKVILY